ncbi:MAG TPA: ABC transporter ATP-binding protein [Planctomycetota bacterium]|nr:ABC transporter ATP-binding protein [Planctomycetota bacterium]
MNDTLAVEVRGVTFRYGDRQALAGIDFTVPRGAVHGFLGPNGSGKSTLFKLLSTIVPPQGGTLMVLGLDLANAAPAVRERLGMVFQSPALDKKLTVRENLRYGGKLYGLHGPDLEQRIDELLTTADLRDRHRDRVGELSGGLRRRVEVAKGLLHQPELLLLDEASTGLDPVARLAMWSLLRSRKGLTVLFTTHLMDEAAEADQLTLLDQGRVVAAGSPADLMRGVGGQVLELQAADAPALAQEVQAAFSVTPQVIDSVVRIQTERVYELVPALMAKFGARVQRLVLAHPSLEDVFINKTGKRFVVEPPAPPTRKGKR